jgi:hypothetical protein
MGPPARGLDAVRKCPRMGGVPGAGAGAGAEPRRVRSHRRASGVRCPATSAGAVCVAWAIVPLCARAGCDTQPSARGREGPPERGLAATGGCRAELHRRRPRCGAGKRSAVVDAATVACRSAREQRAGARWCGVRPSKRPSAQHSIAVCTSGMRSAAPDARKGWGRAGCGVLPLMQRRGTTRGHRAGPQCGERTSVRGQGEVSGGRAWPPASAARAPRSLARESLRVATVNVGASCATAGTEQSGVRVPFRGQRDAVSVAGYLIGRMSASVRQGRAARRVRRWAGRG